MATRRTRRSTTIVTLLLLSAFTIVALSASGTASSFTSGLRSLGSTILSPVVNVMNDVTKPVGQAFEGVFNYGSVTAENARLQAINAQLRSQGLVQSYERHQLSEIDALRNLPFVQNIPLVVAQTMAIDPSNFASTIQISKGRDQGIGVGMPVVGAGGLVGQVILTTKNTATVRLVSDGRSKIGASVGTTSILGIASGQGAGDPLSLDYVAPNSAVKSGQIVYTNGLQGADYPAGIPLGKVSSASTPVNASQMSISLTPLANLSSVAYVDVLLWSPPL